MNFELDCPVDFKKVNENKVRLTAFWVLLLGIAFVSTQWWPIAAFLTIDFAIRAFDFGKYSLLNLLSDFVIDTFSISSKLIEQAPKLFAAKIGLLFTIAISVISLLGNTSLSLYVTSILILFAFLESVLGICAGCYVYTFYKKLFK